MWMARITFQTGNVVTLVSEAPPQPFIDSNGVFYITCTVKHETIGGPIPAIESFTIREMKQES